MQRKGLLILCFITIAGNALLAQRNGFFLAPHILTGFNYIAPIYHLQPQYAPANRGYNLSFQYGGCTGYKGKKLGVQAEVHSAYYQQNFKQNTLVGGLQLNVLQLGGHVFYQLKRIKSSHYYQTIKLGYGINFPQEATYHVKNSADGTNHADENIAAQFTNHHQISAAYGITTGHKLLWADFSLVSSYTITNIYKPLTGIHANNFFLGFSLSFGLFLNTNK